VIKLTVQRAACRGQQQCTVAVQTRLQLASGPWGTDTLAADILLHRQRTRSSALPMNLVARREGHQRLNSFIQLCSVDLGTMTMCGPLMPRYSCRYPSSEIVCSVLPSPCGTAQQRVRVYGVWSTQ